MVKSWELNCNLKTNPTFWPGQPTFCTRYQRTQSSPMRQHTHTKVIRRTTRLLIDIKLTLIILWPPRAGQACHCWGTLQLALEVQTRTDKLQTCARALGIIAAKHYELRLTCFPFTVCSQLGTYRSHHLIPKAQQWKPCEIEHSARKTLQTSVRQMLATRNLTFRCELTDFSSPDTL